MVNQVIEGFDVYPVGASGVWNVGTTWQNVGSDVGNVTTTNAANGTRCFNPGSTGAVASYFRQVIPDDNIYTWGFRFLSTNHSNNQQSGAGIFGTVFLWATCDSAGRIIITRNDVTIWTSAVALPTATQNYIVCQYNKAAGTVEVYLNNTLLDTVVGVVSIGTIQYAATGTRAGAFSSSGVFLDDMYWNSGAGGSWGEIAALPLFGTSNGVAQDWTVTGAASAFQAIDNVPALAGEYIEAAVVGDISDFVLPALPVGIFQVFAVKHQYRGQKTAAGASDVRGRVTAGAAVSPGTSHSLTQSTYADYQDTYELNPDTGLPWVPGDFAGGNVQIGYERTL